MCVGVLLACMAVCHIYDWYQHRPEEGAPGTGVTEGYVSQCGFWESNQPQEASGRATSNLIC